ncbi:hypothetical protein [Pseudomonas zhanjiangensis]|uniref:Uncharacterized protein n=1 Tax=Pseudomonas zhanjiangensis TaxID=3239015 RepID=A0ABV3YT06_9PSED
MANQNQEETDLSLDDLALEPIEDPSDEAQRKGRAKFQIDTRSGVERRKAEQDRRGAIRFQDDRRSGKDRRAGASGWVPGVDI